MDELHFLVGRTVQSISVDYALTLHVEVDGDDGFIALTRFGFDDGAGRAYELDAGRERAAFGPILALFTRVITEATGEHGALHLRFDDGAEITASPSDEFEAWEVVAGSNHVICMPGGELAIWS